MGTFAEIFRAPCFVWACVALAGGCLAAAAAVCAREFLFGLSERFVKLPPSTKAVIVTAIIVATVFAQKPANVSTNQHESARIEEVMPAASAEGSATLNAEEAEARSHGETSTDFTDSHGFEKWVTTNQHESTRIPIRDNSCKFVDETTQGGASATPNAENEEERRHGETSTDFTNSHGSGDGLSTNQHESTQIQIRENPCQSVDVSLCLPTSITSVLSAAGNPTLSSNDVVRGYRLETVRTNAADFSKRPTNARLVGTWHLTDAYRGRAWVRLLDTNPRESSQIQIRDNPCQSVVNYSPTTFHFPIGSHVVTSLWAHTWGKVRPQLRNASNEIVVIGAPMFARHDQSYLWTAATTNGSVVLTWENFFLGDPYERSLSTDSHGLTRIEGGVSATLNACAEETQSVSEGRSQSDSERSELPARAREETEKGRHGEASTDFTDSHGLGDGLATNLHASAQIPIRDNPCQSVDKNPTSSKITPCFPSSNTSALSDSNPPDVSSSDSAREGIRENPCQSMDHPPVTAQLELFPNGDFIARSNEVERVYRRVNPDDWDDDGIPNGEDDAPLAPADEPQFGPHQDLSLITHSNNYYWVDLVAPDANALVAFKGCGASNLPDPSFVAMAGETNRVVLLLGKPYTADCRLPLVCVGASHHDIEIGVDADGRLTVCRPVRCEIVDGSPVAAFRASAVAPRAASGGRRVRFTPAPDGADVSWNGNYCCLEPPPPPFTVPLFNCDGNCGCGGCAVGTYTCRFEGFELSFADWPCGCSHESPPDRPTHPDENAPGETVARRSTETEAKFSVYGGTKGGSYSFELRDGGRLERVGGSFLPREGTVEAGESFKIKVKYKARSASGGAGDVKAVATFTEAEGGEKVTSEASLTVVKVVITPVVMREGFPNRHKMGVREPFRIDAYPQGLESIRLSADWILTPDDAYVCPVRSDGNGVEINSSGVSYVPALTVVEPTGILCTSGFNRCSDGLIAMELEPYITPLDVSFFGVKVMEVPTTGSVPVGYFANPLFEPIWNHTKERKAGVWHRPRQDNYFFADAPSFGEYCPPPHSRGVIDWAIPLAWGDDDAEDVPDAVGGLGTVYHQVFTLDAEGGLRIDKFSQWIHCSADGVVTHSPGIR